MGRGRAERAEGRPEGERGRELPLHPREAGDLTGAALQPLRQPAYRLLWCSSLASAGAQWMERVITSWLALEVGGGAFAVGTVLSLRMAPFVLFGLIAGTVADRFPRRLVLMAVALAAALLAAALGLATSGGGVELWQVVVIGFLGGVVFVFDMPARGAMVVDIVGREGAPGAIALNAVALRFFGAVGAFAGGAVIDLLGTSNGYFVVALTYLVALGLTAAVRVPARTRTELGPPVPFVAAVKEAARLIVDYPALRWVLVVSLAAEMFGYSYQSAMPSVARDVLGTGPEGLGQLTAAASIGSTVAVVLLTPLPSRVPRQPLLSAVLVIWGVALLALGWSSSFWLSLAVMLVVGGCASAVDALQQTLAQMSVPEHQRGRAVGVWVFSIGANLVGLFQVGYLASLLGAPATLLINGVFGLLCGLLIASLVPAFRWRRLVVASRP